MNLDELKIPNTVKVNHLQRKWYGKYIYKLVFEIDKTKLIKASKGNNNYYGFYSQPMYINRRELVDALRKSVIKRTTDTNYRIRVEAYSVSFFTSCDQDVISLVENLGARLQSFDKPVNEAHIDLVTNHTKVLVRKNLFENYYKFKIYFKPDWKERSERFPKIKEWVDTLQCDYKLNSVLSWYLNTKRPIRNLGHTIAVYLNDPGDLMMCQLRFNDQILKIEEAVLVEDLESSSKPS